MRKDVTTECNDVDIKRKKKLLEKQKKGKARMREYGNVSIPQEASIAALRMREDSLARGTNNFLPFLRASGGGRKVKLQRAVGQDSSPYCKMFNVRSSCV